MDSSQPTISFPPVSFSSPTEAVHVEYDINNPPPPPPSDWTRFVCISDTHSRSFQVPPGDVLLHSGDLTNTGTLKDFEKTMGWITSLPHPTKILIAGNHDLTLHEGWYDTNYGRWHGTKKQDVKPIYELVKGEKAKIAGVVYLQDELYELQTKPDGRIWTVYGSPWSPEFYEWAFNYCADEADDLIAKFPKSDILLTHGPPHNLFDNTSDNDHPGCDALAARLPFLRPRLHLFGHIHEAHGAYIHSWAPEAEWTPGVQVKPNSSPNLAPFEVDVDDPDLKPDEENIEARDRTVFVNAANWPSGHRAYVLPKRKFGGTGFLPVIVDMKD